MKAVRSVMKDSNPKAKLKLETIWGSTMYELDDLPFDSNLSDMPNTFTPFRNKVEKRSKINRPLAVPKKGTLSLPTDASPVGS